MPLTLLLLPRLHGALGWWDELLINLIPVVVGIVLVLVLYRTSRRRRNATDDAPAAAPDQDTSDGPTRN